MIIKGLFLKFSELPDAAFHLDLMHEAQSAEEPLPNQSAEEPMLAPLLIH